MADAAVAKAKRNVPRESAIPTEVIHSIVSYLVASFIDDLFEGTLALSVDMDSQIGKDEQALQTLKDIIASDKIFGVTYPNPVFPLLSVSYQFRHITLETLSKILNIPYVRDGTGRLEEVKPWSSISAFRRFTWSLKHSYTTPPCPEDGPDGPDEPDEPAPYPVLTVYLSLAMLQREAHCAWAYVNAPSHAVGDYKRVTGAWRFGVVDSWMRYALAHLDRCSEMFFDVLRPRVADACINARIAELYAMHLHHLCGTWTRVKEWHHRIATAGDLGDAPEGAQIGFEDMVQVLLVMLKIVLMRDKALHDAADKLPPTRPVDEMVRGENYLAYLETLAEISDWDAKGGTNDECKVLARSLIKIFKRRVQAIEPYKPCSTDNGEDGKGDTSIVEDAEQKDEGREAANVGVS